MSNHLLKKEYTEVSYISGPLLYLENAPDLSYNAIVRIKDGTGRERGGQAIEAIGQVDGVGAADHDQVHREQEPAAHRDCHLLDERDIEGRLGCMLAQHEQPHAYADGGQGLQQILAPCTQAL